MKKEHALSLRTRIAAIGCTAILSVGLMVPFAPAHAVTAAQVEAAVNNLSAAQDKVAVAADNYNQAVAEQQEAQAKVEAAHKVIEEKTAIIQANQGQLSDRARSMYRSGEIGYLDVVLGASSWQSFISNWDILETLNQKDANLILQTKEARTAAEAAKKEAVEQEEVAAKKAEEAASSLKEAEQAAAGLAETLAGMTAELQAAAASQMGIVGGGGGGGYAGGGGGGGASYAYSGANEILQRAYALLGSRYVYGSGGEDGTWDCSGLVGYAVTGSTGHALGSTSSIQGMNRIDASQAQPGDIVCNNGHTGIYIGDGQFINALGSEWGVVISDLDSYNSRHQGNEMQFYRP